MKLKTSELTGRALDYAVAMIEHSPTVISESGKCIVGIPNLICRDFNGNLMPEYYPYSPSTDWALCGQLIDKYLDDLAYVAFRGPYWIANSRIVRLEDDFSIFQTQEGKTPQIAICRAVVASQLGNEIDIPDELLEPEGK
ncbi:phage protein NinX family protein [Xenorhabdus szentirmaii]|uniref:phage protein NinX family protein n=1 Tax=Xenorhabdus szentirmaii TaxID=290112 RepID=UPI000C049F78|nr:phage protein NinX family protein [Xenorhabdus szentirmaii]PHM42369.1 hypothetical protein Xszus_02103 [Xenorhabdus szentirmaii]